MRVRTHIKKHSYRRLIYSYQRFIYRDCGDFNEKAAAARQRLLSRGQGLQSRLMTAQAMRAPALPVGWVV